MVYRNTSGTYGSVSKFFHWLVVLLFFAQLALGLFMSRISNDALQSAFYTLHKSLGLLILLVMIVFVLWSLTSIKPKWPVSMSCWERSTAHSIHGLLYLLLLAMPLSGWLLATAAGHPPNFFWLVTVPMPGINISESLAELGGTLHLIFVWLICFLVGIHILAALKHHFISKDNILRRMWFNR